MIAGLQRVSGGAGPDEPADSTEPVVNFTTALSVGDTWLLSALWQRLGLAAGLHRVLRSGRSPVQAEALLRVMVFNRLCQPCSKPGVMRWLEGAQVPGMDRREVTHQRLLRAMDVLAERRSEVPQELRAYGLSKEGGIARQVLLGVVQTAEGLPLPTGSGRATRPNRRRCNRRCRRCWPSGRCDAWCWWPTGGC